MKLAGVKGHWYDDTAYLVCVNERCPWFNVPVLAPRLAVERADPAIVARVEAEEREAERERQAAREEESRRVLGDDWWRCHGYSGSGKKIGDTIHVKTPQRFVPSDEPGYIFSFDRIVPVVHE